jgi:hypothetical protein
VNVDNLDLFTHCRARPAIAQLREMSGPRENWTLGLILERLPSVEETARKNEEEKTPNCWKAQTRNPLPFDQLDAALQFAQTRIDSDTIFHRLSIFEVWPRVNSKKGETGTRGEARKEKSVKGEIEQDGQRQERK